MKVVLAHNFYQQPGGEDVVFATERALLEAHGVDVVEFTRTNSEIGRGSRARLAAATIWSAESKAALRRLLVAHRPDVVHFHNTFPLIPPAAYHACHSVRIPVVQTLHNYRLVCPAATLYRDGGPCEDCVGRAVAWPAVWHRCYRTSAAASATIAGMLSVHHGLKTWTTLVHVYIALSEFARQKFIQGGLPASRIAVKANSLSVLPEPGGGHDGGFALFVGRLVPEKGIVTMLEAWRRAATGIPLRIAGDGALRTLAGAGEQRGVEWLGSQTRESVLALMRAAAYLILPSEWYEGGFPLVAQEAFACGLPVIASRIGCLQEAVREGVTGLLFTPGDPADLAAKLKWAADNPGGLHAMGRSARAMLEAEYSPERNLEGLLAIYERAAVCARTPA